VEPMIYRKRWPGKKSLDAARPAATARRSRDLVRRRPGHRVVAPFSGNRLGPEKDPSSRVIPAPTPVPRTTPKTVSMPTAAPSVASDRIKQLASAARRVGRPIAVSRSCCSGRPLSQVELALFTNPVIGEIVPGIPIPTGVVSPICSSINRTRALIVLSSRNNFPWASRPRGREPRQGGQRRRLRS
jgi:hypothetical protein